MPSNNDLTRRLRLLEQRQQQLEAANSAEEDTHDYGPSSIVVFEAMDPGEGVKTHKPSEQLRIDHLVSRLRAEAQAAHYTGHWHLSVTVAEDGSLEVAALPWWSETPAPASTGGFDANAALAAITGTGSRRYA